MRSSPSSFWSPESEPASCRDSGLAAWIRTSRCARSDERFVSGVSLRTALILLLSAAPCAAQAPDATTRYFDRLLRGDSTALLAGFVGAPAIDDPIGGRVRSRAALDRFVAERPTWLVGGTGTLGVAGPHHPGPR